MAGRVIEWNPHVFSNDRVRFPLHAGGTDRPEASHFKERPVADRIERMNREGIDGSVLVQAGAYGDDHRLLLDCLAQEPERLRGSALFYPRDPEAPRKLEALARDNPGVVAVRFHGVKFYQDSFLDSGVRSLWRTAGRLGLVIEVHFRPPVAAEVLEVVRMFPGFPVVVDHLARPREGTAVEYAHVLELARHPNVYMKLSGLDLLGGTAPLHLQVQAFTRRVADVFGADRLVWGGGSPTIVDAHLEHFSTADRDKVKGGNLARLLGFSPPTDGDRTDE